MIWNYLKIALRNLARYKIYSLINISGLAIGMASFFLTTLYIQFEFSYDKFHKDNARIYRVVRKVQTEDYTATRANTGAPMGPLLLEEFPEIENAVRFALLDGIISYNDKHFFEEDIYFSDAQIFEVFNFPLVKGNPTNALKEPFSIILTKEMAIKYFGDEDPIGKTITYENRYDFKVTGVLKNIPDNSHIQFDFLASIESARTIYGQYYMTQHWDSPAWTYIKLNKDSSHFDLENKFPDFVDKYMDKGSYTEVGLKLEPLRDIYLYSKSWGQIGKIGDIRSLQIFSMVALFILLIACINFMNLATAHSVIRTKEVGLRKVLGAPRSQLIRQFLGESLVYSFIALIVSFIVTEVFRPTFNNLAGKVLSFDYLSKIGYIAVFVGITIIVGIISGSYPAVFLSSFQPVKVLKGTFKVSTEGIFRKSLVIFQFAASILLIISTIIIYQQLNYLQSKELGFNQEQLITIPIRSDSVRNRYKVFRNELLKNKNIKAVSASSTIPGAGSPNGISIRSGGFEESENAIVYVDFDYFQTLEIELIEGRYFSREIASDYKGAFLMNESQLKRMGWQSAEGKEVELYFMSYGKKVPRYSGKFIGIVKDFHFRSLFTRIQPVIFAIEPGNFNCIVVRISEENIQGSVDLIRERWLRLFPNQPFEFSFLDDAIDYQYREHINFGEIFRYASILAIFIACLGLFGLASFSTARRIKEIGIRKVLGASVPNIVFLLSSKLLILVLLSNILAWPIAFYFTNHWLQSFSYRVNVNIVTFLVGAFLAFIIATITVCYHAIRVANTDPVNVLRYE